MPLGWLHVEVKVGMDEEEDDACLHIKEEEGERLRGDSPLSYYYYTHTTCFRTHAWCGPLILSRSIAGKRKPSLL